MYSFGGHGTPMMVEGPKKGVPKRLGERSLAIGLLRYVSGAPILLTMDLTGALRKIILNPFSTSPVSQRNVA